MPESCESLNERTAVTLRDSNNRNQPLATPI